MQSKPIRYDIASIENDTDTEMLSILHISYWYQLSAHSEEAKEAIVLTVSD